ncbi:uncharacterized protein PgNI_07975 [Pyricularia grisea]|uniref:FAD-binding PCMH-type domain-containing protein n=1 Tax=Pyricularia grisea TaxID=148305 RepID=A0A6P8B043_PYRGI|nr:uncharacterized protein PgNI_07975 [Pyricularia grisea]TLD08280.1 hypothetical protein PgNI_07975 [Pyricularia grisea]
MQSIILAVIFILNFRTQSLVQGAPSEADWQELQEAVGGRLFTAEPLARPCFSTFQGKSVEPNLAECITTKQDYLNSTFKTAAYAGFVHSYNEACASNVTDQCLLSAATLSTTGGNDTTTAAPLTGPCNQGILSEKYIAVARAEDVQAAFRFALRTGIPLSVKATGHDYAARSSRKGSLALWTRQLSGIEFNPSFSPAGSSTSPVAAITVGSGANLGEVYKFADGHNVTFIGGSSGTVAAAGGFSLLGGHGTLTPLYGMSADRILELTVVTPDGELRKANADTNQDLFWALRGAGSATFGVVLDATFKVEPVIPITLALMSFNATSLNTDPFLSLLINHTSIWAEEGWGGPMSMSTLALVNPTMSLDAANSSMQEVANYVSAQGGTIILERLPSFYSFFTKYVESASSTGTGTATFATFRTLPKSLHQSEEGRAAMIKTIQNIKAAGLDTFIFQTTPNKSPYVPGSNTVHPSWRDSYWLVGTSISWPSNDASLEERMQVAAILQEVSKNLTDLAPAGSMYPNEADPWTKNWAKEFWGEGNYAKLLQVKMKYDPNNLIGCWKCVGFEDGLMETDPAMQCLGAFQTAGN